MPPRIRGLQHVDPAAVHLPNGTEVSTRVDRKAGDRIARQGAVGRVVATRDDVCDVFVVGFGVLTYQRSEIVPRKAGQTRFAARRQAAWEELSGCMVLETVVGSQAWGLADEASDVDRRGAFVVPWQWTTGLVPLPGELVSADGSATYWEVGKLITQALRADPNTLETLFVPGAQALDPMGEWILFERDAFVSKGIYGSFARYALSQLDRLRQASRLAEHRAIVLGWLAENPNLGLDDVARRLAVEAKIAAPTPADAELQAKEYVKQLYRSLHDQGLIEACDFSSLARHATSGGKSPDLPRELRPKNAYNLVRLLWTALGWLKTGEPEFRLGEPMRSRLLAIKRGEVALTDVIAEAEALAPELDAARASTRLPAQPDISRADALLRRLREETAKRFLARAPGPWGADAPEPPRPVWEDV